jgi:hypothetical protein
MIDGELEQGKDRKLSITARRRDLEAFICHVSPLLYQLHLRGFLVL